MQQFILNIEKKILESAKKDLEAIQSALYIEIIKKTPVDTGTYMRQHVIKPIYEEKDTVIAEIENIGEYPERVEGGFRKTAVNWHTNEGIYRSVGADTYKRSVKKIAPLIKTLGNI